MEVDLFGECVAFECQIIVAGVEIGFSQYTSHGRISTICVLKLPKPILFHEPGHRVSDTK